MTLRSRNNQGFTFVEVMVAVAVGAIILLGLYVLLETSQSTTSRGKLKLEIQQAARAALDTMARDLRMAGSGLPNARDYQNPPAAFTGATDNSVSFMMEPSNANTVFTAGVATGSVTLPVNSTSQFTPGGVIYLFGNDGDATHPMNHWEQKTIAAGGVGANSLTLTSGVSNNYIGGSQVSQPRTFTYDLSGTTLRRNAGDGNGPQPLAENITALQLRYFDNNDSEINNPGAGGQLDKIRRMEISITAFKADRLRGDQTYVLMSSVNHRNIQD